MRVFPLRLTLTVTGLLILACTGTSTEDSTDGKPDRDHADADTDTDSDTDSDSDSDADTDSDTDADAVFVKVPGSTFLMGCTDGQSDCDSDETEHSVTLTHDYFVGVTEVTQGQFEALMGYNPAYFWTDCGTDSAPTRTADCPVNMVSWYMSAAYANAMSAAAGLSLCYTCTGAGSDVDCDVTADPYDCNGYRLLTEAEWEGAARCGRDTEYAGSNTSTDVAWTAENSGVLGEPVAGLAPNACGLYDMSGNVGEWTQDWYDDYPSGGVPDPIGAESGSNRVYRGGSWAVAASDARVANREHYDPASDSSGGIGFRLSRSSP